MIELGIAVIVIAAIGFIAYPLVKAKPADEAPSANTGVSGVFDERMNELLNQRDSIYRAIKEIEFDHQVGSLSDADYVDLRERYKGRALTTLKAIHDLEAEPGPKSRHGRQSQEPEDAIEQAVRSRRARAKATGGAELTCRKCGTPYAAGSRFCANCGEPLARSCPTCGTPYADGARFCAHCGTSLVASVQGVPSRP